MALDLRSKGQGFDSHHWSCVEVSDILLITHCFCLPNNDGYLVDKNCVLSESSSLHACVGGVLCILPGDMRLLKWCVSYTKEGNCRLNIM